MSRSYKHTPISSWCSTAGQKKFKQQEHRAERKHVKQKLQQQQPDKINHPKEYGNEWSSPRDGKWWCGLKKWMKESWFAEIMRK